MRQIDDWARKWSVPPAALAELYLLAGASPVGGPPDGRSEAAVQADIRLEASAKGCRLWRNNVGVLFDRNGRPVRYGLANETPEMNRRVKSSDLIGIRPLEVRQSHVGKTLGIFVSREVKPRGWKYVGDEHEQAQLAWIMFVLSMGGDACFACDTGTI